jgi:RimJ/RimL family protein N-acetyltransferase
VLLPSGDLVIAPLASDDLDAFLAYRRDPEVARYQSWTTAYSRADAERLLAEQADWEFPPPGEWVQLAVRAADGTLLGDVAVHPLEDQPDSYELGVTIAPAAQGRGIAGRALAAVVDHLVRVRGAHRILATCDTRNEPVRRMLARVGFTHEGTAREADWFKEEWTTVETWAVLAREWRD